MTTKAVQCSTPSQAVKMVMAAQDCATAICWSGTASLDVHLGASTAFGPSIRSWQGVSRRFVDDLVADTLRAAAGPVYTSEGRGAAAAVQALTGMERKVPYKELAGIRTSMWWTSAKVVGKAFSIGDVLFPRIERCAQGWDVRYRSMDGRDAGLHVRLGAEPDARQRGIVQQARARVERFAFGSEIGRGGQEIRTQLLVLSIPHSLAEAFPKGRLPRIDREPSLRSA